MSKEFCSDGELLWSDEDHFSYRGKMRFGMRLSSSFLD